MSHPALLRRISLIAAIALAHQLGACACGCLEHNGWVLAAASLVGSPDAPASTEGSAPCLEHADCDGAGAVYLAGDAPRPEAAAAGATAAAAAAPLAALTAPAPTARADSPAASGPAPAVRAKLGVFLL